MQSTLTIAIHSWGCMYNLHNSESAIARKERRREEEKGREEKGREEKGREEKEREEKEREEKEREEKEREDILALVTCFRVCLLMTGES